MKKDPGDIFYRMLAIAYCGEYGERCWNCKSEKLDYTLYGSSRAAVEGFLIICEDCGSWYQSLCGKVEMGKGKAV